MVTRSEFSGLGSPPRANLGLKAPRVTTLPPGDPEIVSSGPVWLS